MTDHVADAERRKEVRRELHDEIRSEHAIARHVVLCCDCGAEHTSITALVIHTRKEHQREPSPTERTPR